MSMAHGLEVRAPFLDYRLAEWALGLSENLKLNGSVLKVLLRKRAGMLWGPEIADRPKLGFSIPIHSWVRHQMRDLIEDLLSPDSLRKIDVLSFTEVQKVLKEHMSGARSWGFEIWGLAVMVAWHRLRIQGAEISGEENFLIERKFPQASL
jgi:asparagine synthase (glutamine-hydrolysing)